MALIKKDEFVKKFLKHIRKELLRDLPDEDFLSTMIDKSDKLIFKYLNNRGEGLR